MCQPNISCRIDKTPIGGNVGGKPPQKIIQFFPTKYYIS